MFSHEMVCLVNKESSQKQFIIFILIILILIMWKICLAENSSWLFVRNWTKDTQIQKVFFTANNLTYYRRKKNMP